MAHNPIPGIPLTSIFTFGLFRAAILIITIILLHHKLQLPAALMFFILLITEISRLWSSAGLRNLAAEYDISPVRTFPDEKIDIIIKISNRKLLPTIFSWSLKIAPELDAQKSQKATKNKQEKISGVNVLKWHSSYMIKKTLQAHQRGYYRFPPLLICSQDALGLYAHQAYLGHEKQLIVYPRLLPLPELDLTPANLIGNRSVQRQILPDPIRTVGLRDYTPDMPARLINWKASACQDQLLAKVLEPSSELKLCLAIDVGVFPQTASPSEYFEAALSLAASMACWAEDQGVPYGLLANGDLKGASGPVNIPINCSPNQAPRVLESMARMELKPLLPLWKLLKSKNSRLPWGTTLFIIGSGNYEVPPEVCRVILHPYTNSIPLSANRNSRRKKE